MKAALAFALLATAFTVTLLTGPWGDERVSDLFLYRGYALAFLDGRLPYRDLPFEYPPLAAPLIALAELPGTGQDDYRLAFAALALALSAAVVLLTGALAERTGGDRRTAMLVVALMPLLTGAMLRTHFDLAPLALTLGALVLLCHDRPRAGFAVLGLGVMTKGFPLVVAPVALGWLVARGQRRAALSSAVVLALTVGTIAAAAAVVSTQGAVDAVRYHLDRPVQVESTPASVLLALDAVGAGTARGVFSHGSDGLLHPVAEPLAALFAALLLGTIALCAVATGRQCRTLGPPDARRVLVLCSLTAVVAFAALGKVLSPQFLIWLMPLPALALVWGMRALAAVAAGAIALTLVEFPAHYRDVAAHEPLAVGLVAARNALLLAAIVLALRTAVTGLAAATGGSAARWRLPVRPRRPPPARR